MLVEASPEYQSRVRSLRERLVFDFQPLRDTLTKGLDVLVDVSTPASDCACGL